MKHFCGSAAVSLLLLAGCSNDTVSDEERTSVTLAPATIQPAPELTTESPASSAPESADGEGSEGSEGDSGEGDAVEEEPAAETTSEPPTTTSAAPVDAQPTRVGLRLIGEYDAPLAAIIRPGDTRFFLLERAGRVVPINPDSGTADRAVLDISNDVSNGGERGLLGGAFSPDGSALYLHYSDRNGDTQVDRWAVDPDGTIDQTTRSAVFSLAQPFGNHNGGQLEFGPDGFLYLGLGDGGAADDPLGAGQDTNTTLGSIIRIDPEGGDPYAIPADNPFVLGGGEPEIFLVGVRNPWRFSFDRETGDLWIGDVGQDRIEEVTVLRSTDGGGLGANLGWRLREGTEDFSGDPPVGHVGPIYEYGHGGGNCSITGGYVYRGQAIPALVGNYVFADFCVGELVIVGQTGDATELGLVVEGREVVSFAEDSAGELYVISQSGRLFKLILVEG